MKTLTYTRNGLKITIIIQDENWKKIGTFKYEENDKKKKDWAIRTIKDKYNISFKPEIDRDIDWLKQDLF